MSAHASAAPELKKTRRNGRRQKTAFRKTGLLNGVPHLPSDQAAVFQCFEVPWGAASARFHG